MNFNVSTTKRQDFQCSLNHDEFGCLQQFQNNSSFSISNHTLLLLFTLSQLINHSIVYASAIFVIEANGSLFIRTSNFVHRFFHSLISYMQQVSLHFISNVHEETKHNRKFRFENGERNEHFVAYTHKTSASGDEKNETVIFVIVDSWKSIFNLA